MKCPLCESKFYLIEWNSNAEPCVVGGHVVGFIAGTHTAKLRCSKCTVEVRVHGKDTSKAMEGALR